MQNKTINELTSLENPRLTDTLPIWDGTEGKTKKVSLAKIPANVITPVNSLPESPNILDRVYRYNNKYYVGNESAQTLTELALKADIPTVVDTVENGNMNPVTSNAVYDAIGRFDHNIPRWVNGVLGKDITSYVSDGSIWKRLNGTDGYSYLEDIYVGDYFQMSRAITCPNSYEGTIGSAWVTIAGINTLQGNGDTVDMMYNHLVMIPGKGEGGSFHFGRQAMNTTGTTTDGYKASRMRTSVLGPVVSAGSTASGATINQQLYAEFGSHLKTTRELITNALNANGVNRFGSASGCSSNWEWSSEQAILMSEVEVYGSIVWSSSGYDTGSAKVQLPLFRYSTKALNNRSSWYWLKDIASAAYFCGVSSYGRADYSGAGDASGFARPRFVLAA